MQSIRTGESLGQRLLEMKEDLEEMRSERSELQGEINSLMKQLEKYGITSLEDAEKHITKSKETLDKMKKDIEQQLHEIEAGISHAK